MLDVGMTTVAPLPPFLFRELVSPQHVSIPRAVVPSVLRIAADRASPMTLGTPRDIVGTIDFVRS